jgi:formamidopyrimidine-DNA glycosylase
MPELPEVQTVVSELNRKITGKTIKSVEVRATRSAQPSPEVLIAKTKNKKVKEVKRRGKLIDIDLGGNHNILIHLKMTGQLVYVSRLGKKVSGQPASATPKALLAGQPALATPKALLAGGHPIGLVGELPNKFSHVIINFTDGSTLYFNDIRKFGWVKYATNIERDIARQRYGLEPFDKEYNLKNFTAILKRYPKRKIKQLLMDQEKISGLGNIYADESLFASHVLPTRLAGSLKPKEIELLFKEIPKILKLAISKGGTTADNYVRTDGSKGEMIKYLKVYGKGGEKCVKCKNEISKIKLGGRGTHFCKTCQK